MTIPEAEIIWNRFYDKQGHYNDEDFFLFTEAALFLICETRDPHYMFFLGNAYQNRKDFELAYKYYQMAADHGYEDAYEGLGYIWYYGRLGNTDYQKAFECFSKAVHNINAQVKVADMYHRGYYVEKDETKYREIIESLYKKCKKRDDWDHSALCVRLAEIREQEEDTEAAIRFWKEAKRILTAMVTDYSFFGTYSVLCSAVRNLYRLIPLDTEHLDLYDLYEVLRKSAKVQLTYHGKQYPIEAAEESDGTVAVCFNGKWYRSVEDMMMKAEIGGELLSLISWDIDRIEVV